MNNPPMKCTDLINLIRRKCLLSGFGSLTNFGFFFRKLDQDFSREISKHEFQVGLASHYDLHITETDCSMLFEHFDVNNSGTIDFQELVRMLQPPISAKRSCVVEAVFNKISTSGSGVIRVEDLKEHFKGKLIDHPKYVKGLWSEDEVLENLIAGFEQPHSKDGQVTLEEFINYYSAVSALVENDDCFENSLKLCWHIEGELC